MTGGGSGIGRAISLLFAKKGAKVEIVDIDLKKAEEVAAEISKAKGSAAGAQLDVTDQKKVFDLFGEIAGRNGGKIDILVNNAGVSSVGTVEQCDEVCVYLTLALTLTLTLTPA